MAPIVLLLACLAYSAVAQRCPPEEDLAPYCLCRAFGSFSMMDCDNIDSVEDLIPLIRATEGYEIFSLNFEDSSLMYLPRELFKRTKIEKISFGNSQVMSLSDSDLAFEGLENHLVEIRATGAHYVATWDWSQLRNLKKLQLMDVNNIEMHHLDIEFPHLESLTALGISSAKITFLHPNAFRSLSNLGMLILKENEISEITRDMLPNPAHKLHHLDLSHNLLHDLPDDIFKDMPSLKEVHLGHNQFTTLKEEIFSPVMMKLQMLYLNGNEFRCDCRLEWMVDQIFPLYFQGECQEPQKLKGRSLMDLYYPDLYC